MPMGVLGLVTFSKIMLKHITLHNTTIFGVVNPIVTIKLPAENDKGNGGVISFQCSCPGNHYMTALGVCNKLRCFRIVHKALLEVVNAYLRKLTDSDGLLTFRTNFGKQNTPTWRSIHWKFLIQGILLINQVKRDKHSRKILGLILGEYKIGVSSGKK